MYSVAKSIAQPYCALLLMVALGLLLLARHKPVSWRRIAMPSVGWLGLVLLSLPLVSRSLSTIVESGYPPPYHLPSEVDAIVVLGGGLHPSGQFLVSSSVTSSTLRRCVSAAEVYRRCGEVPIVCCGGATLRDRPELSEAEAMRDCLVLMQIPAARVILEKRSRNTRENATHALEILQRRGLENVVLVTSAGHMKRAVSCFNSVGIDVVPLPCSHRRRVQSLDHVKSWIPSASALSESNGAMQECLGLMWYKIRGWT